MAMEPAAISASPAVTTTCEAVIAPERPAARAKGTVRPSLMPMTMSRRRSEPWKWRSTWGVAGMRRGEWLNCARGAWLSARAVHAPQPEHGADHGRGPEREGGEEQPHLLRRSASGGGGDDP